MAGFNLSVAAAKVAARYVAAARVYHERALVADVNGDYDVRREECDWRDEAMGNAERIAARFPGIVIPDVSSGR